METAVDLELARSAPGRENPPHRAPSAHNDGTWVESDWDRPWTTPRMARPNGSSGLPRQPRRDRWSAEAERPAERGGHGESRRIGRRMGGRRRGGLNSWLQRTVDRHRTNRRQARPGRGGGAAGPAMCGLATPPAGLGTQGDGLAPLLFSATSFLLPSMNHKR